MKERDTQRSRVYEADEALVPFARPLPTIEDIKQYVERVFSLKRLWNAFPTAMCDFYPTVGDGRGRRRACGSAVGIKIPLWARNEGVVLHELAHTVCQREHGTEVAPHGWQFCSIYLTLTLHANGRAAHNALRAAFKRHRVRYTAPRKRQPLSPERKAALLERLAAARARRMANAISRFPGKVIILED
jgi:putative metallohydrolase (TIGR04338 family)